MTGLLRSTRNIAFMWHVMAAVGFAAVYETV